MTTYSNIKETSKTKRESLKPTIVQANLLKWFALCLRYRFLNQIKLMKIPKPTKKLIERNGMNSFASPPE